MDISSCRESCHPLIVRREKIYGNCADTEFDADGPFEKRGVKKGQSVVMINVYVLLTLLYYRFTMHAKRSQSELEAICRDYKRLVEETPDQAEFRRGLKEIPCVNAYYFLASEDLRLDKKTRISLLTEGAASQSTIELVASLVDSTYEELVWQEDRPIFWDRAGAWSLRRQFIRRLTSGHFRDEQVKRENILPKLKELAVQDVNLQQFPSLEPSFGFAIQKWVEEGFIELDVSDPQEEKAYLVAVDDRMLESTVQMRLSVLRCELESRIEWLRNEASSQQVREFFRVWNCHIKALDDRLPAGKKSREARHALYMWISLYQQTTVHSILEKSAQFFLRWRMFLKMQTKSGSIVTPASYQARMKEFNREKLEIQKSLFAAVESCVNDKGEIRSIDPALKRDVALIRSTAKEALLLQQQVGNSNQIGGLG